MNRVFYKLNMNNDIDYFYEIPCATNFSGLWEKHYSVNEKYCTPMLDCTDENIVEKILFRFYDNPPYQETKEQEEEYNNLLSIITILFHSDMSKIEEVCCKGSRMNVINESDLPSDNKLIISTILHH